MGSADEEVNFLLAMPCNCLVGAGAGALGHCLLGEVGDVNEGGGDVIFL